MTQIARGLALAALTLAGQVAFAQTMYRVVEITGGDPLAITSNGKILVNGSNFTYYVCDETHCRSLPLVREDPLTHWNSLNDQGMLTGDAKKPNSGQQWAVRKNPQQGGGSRFLMPGAGKAIAPDGAVVGTTNNYHAFLYTDRSIELTGLAAYPDPKAINSHHVIVGSSEAADHAEHATMWIDGGLPQDLGLASGYAESVAMAINDAGVAVGKVRSASHYRPARFADGKVQVFMLPNDEDDGQALAINIAGTIVGSMLLNRGEPTAGIVEGDRMVDLNTRLRPEDTLRYNLWSAKAINDAGQIAALHVDPETHQGKVVRLEPID
jgi:hypothetical protein